MWKKLLMGTLLVGLIGALVVGAVIRTADRVTKTADAHDGPGRAGAEAADPGNGGRWSAGDGAVAVTEGGWRGGAGSDGRAVTSSEPGGGQAQVDAWITVDGRVSEVDDRSMTMTTADGATVTVGGRAWWLAREEGFAAEPGDEVRLTGFYEDGDLEVGVIESMTAGTMVQLREESGRPLWAGRGRRDT
jgi:hypothetical protein